MESELFYESKEETIQGLRNRARENDEFLNGEGFLYHHDYLYTSENVDGTNTKDFSFLLVFMIQLIVVLLIFLLYVGLSYDMLPVSEAWKNMCISLLEGIL